MTQLTNLRVSRRVLLTNGISLSLALPALATIGAADVPPPAMRWVIDGQLARGSRPGFTGGPSGEVSREAVDAWLARARTFGIRSIICLLNTDELALYRALPTDLISYYRARGFAAAHISVQNGQSPPLTDGQLAAVWRAYQQLPKPVLVHCNAGMGRAGAAVDYIVGRLGVHTSNREPQLGAVTLR